MGSDVKPLENQHTQIHSLVSAYFPQIIFYPSALQTLAPLLRRNPSMVSTSARPGFQSVYRNPLGHMQKTPQSNARKHERRNENKLCSLCKSTRRKGFSNGNNSLKVRTRRFAGYLRHGKGSRLSASCLNPQRHLF